MSDEQFDGVDACAFCGDPVGCDGRCEVVEERIRVFRAVRDARALVVGEGDHELDAMEKSIRESTSRVRHPSMQSVIEAIQLGQLLAYGSVLTETENSSDA